MQSKWVYRHKQSGSPAQGGVIGMGTGQVLLDGWGVAVRQQMCPYSGEAVGSALITLAVKSSECRHRFMCLMSISVQTC